MSAHRFDRSSVTLLTDALDILDEGFASLPAHSPEIDIERAQTVLSQAATQLQNSYPFHHPLYMGQMLKPPHSVARAAYALVTWLNPNNHALDGGPASSEMEKEAVAGIAKMFGWTQFLGHLCGGGTMANFEALWVARQLHPGKAIAASAQAHYTHSRLAAVLDVPFVEIAVDANGRMDIAALEKALQGDEIGTVVATLGTTAIGSVDPLPDILALRTHYAFRLHVDTAYGGYYALADNLAPPAKAAFANIAQADSIVIDPHKHGLQPYGCGCVLFRDPAVGCLYQHDSPYTYFSSAQLHLGEISLECSRAGAAAVALLTTMRYWPLQPGGEFAQSLQACRAGAMALYEHLQSDDRFVPVFEPELDIVCWAVRAATSKEASQLARSVFDAAAKLDLHLAVVKFPRQLCIAANPVDSWDSEQLVCLRACVMKPEHFDWMPQLCQRLDQATDSALTPR